MSPRAGLDLIKRPKEVEASLWRRFRYEGDTSCREMLFNRYLGLARSIALSELRRRPSHGLEKADFEQLAYSGLLESIDRFDPLRGTPFDAYAAQRIRGAISDGIAKSSESGAQYTHRRRMETDRLRSFHANEGSKPGDYVAELSDLAAALAIGIMAENAKATGVDWHAHHPELEAYESLSWRDMQMSILTEIERLPETERSVMQQHYFNGVPFTQIAHMLGVSKGRVSQIHRAAVLRVRERLRRFS